MWLFLTATNRIAFDGQIDFAKDSIPGITISVVDKNGCSLMDQKLLWKNGKKMKTGKLTLLKRCGVNRQFCKRHRR